MPRSRAPPPTSSAAIGVNPVRARHAASVWRRSRANGCELGDVTLGIRAHASDVAGSACDATKPSRVLGVLGVRSNGSFQCFAIASVTCLPARAMLRLNTALPR